jgi:ADP-ribose pyrophosphatase
MNSKRLEEYLALIRDSPELFINPEGNIIRIVTDRAEMLRIALAKEEELTRVGMPAAWAQAGIVYEDQFLRIVRDVVVFPDESAGTYIRITQDEKEPRGVVVLPVFGDKIILLSHFRHATRTWHLELPRGFGEPGKSAEANATRELFEEIEGRASHFHYLGSVFPDTGLMAGRVDVVYAEVLSYGEAEMKEAIREIIPVSPAMFEDLIRNGEISDGFSLSAWSMAKANGFFKTRQ